MTPFDTLCSYSLVVADTADFRLLAQFKPTDATTNPSLILKTVQNPKYATWFKAHVTKGDALLNLLVAFGVEIARQVKRVSTEVDVRLSYDTQATVAQAKKLIALYRDAGIARDRILIKIASTLEGIEAARILELEGIHCNLTLLFSIEQARACAAAKVQLISPFVGRVSDWYANASQYKKVDFGNEDDPGVTLVRNIYYFYKANAIDTKVMAASFRNTKQIRALAGCDLLTISPALLEQLQSETEMLVPKLAPHLRKEAGSVAIDQHTFLTGLTANAMAYEQLGAGIRAFVRDTETLEQLLARQQPLT